MNRRLLVAIVVGTTTLVAFLDFWTSAELVVSILFTLPLALCALQRSKRLLWGTAAVTVLLTIAAKFWGFNRVEVLHLGIASVNRGFLIASLLTLTIFIHFWIERGEKIALNATEIDRQTTNLAAQNERLEILEEAANRDLNVRKKAEKHLAQLEGNRRLGEEALRDSEERYRMLLDGVRDYAVFMMDPQGQIITWNAGAERIKGYRADEIVGHSFSCFFTPEDIQRGKPKEILRLAAASGRHEEQGMRVRKDGSRFLASVTFTALRDTAGNLLGFSEFSHDLSESKESGAKYRGLLEAAPDAMVVVNQSGEIVLLNVQAEKQFGYSRDELVGQRVTNIIPVGFAERLIADDLRSAADALEQQIGTGIELIARRKNGTEFPIEIMLSPLESAEGILVTAAIRDISVRNAAEKNLARIVRELSIKHQLLDAVVEGTTDLIYIRDLENRFTFANNACAKTFKLTATEMLGRNMRELLPNESYYAVAESDKEIVRAGATSTTEELAEIEGIARIFLTTKSPYRDADQKTIGTIGISREITERRKLEEARLEELKRDIVLREAAEKHLAQMESTYRGLLEAAPDAMVIADAHGRIVLVNAATEQMFGYRRDELVGQLVEILVPERFQGKYPQCRQGYTAHPRTREMGDGIELRGLRKNNAEFPVEIMLSPLESAEGMLVSSSIRDVTERKRTEEYLVKTVAELKRSNDELEQFAYVASHDLQEPLRMVASYTQLLAERYKGRLDSDADEFIAYAVDGSTRMQGLIQDLLAYSRAGTNGKELQEVSSEDALKEALTNLRGTIEESGAIVTHGPLPAITTDSMQLEQVFQNLIGNAVKYRSTKAPRVYISAAKNGGGEWIFSVRDNGMGIDPQYFERIFVLFQRLHGREEFKGTGIGLAICKKMLERLGGRIWLESQPGEGSTFYFALPGRNGK